MNIVDKILNLETEWGDIWISKELAKEIIAALRAAKDIRDAYADYIQGECASYTIEEIYVQCPEIKAYDTVTKGDK